MALCIGLCESIVFDSSTFNGRPDVCNRRESVSWNGSLGLDPVSVDCGQSVDAPVMIQVVSHDSSQL